MEYDPETRGMLKMTARWMLKSLKVNGKSSDSLIAMPSTPRDEDMKILNIERIEMADVR